MPDDAARPALAQVNVIVVTYNSAHCLPYLAGPLADFPHVTVVDNASHDGTATEARRLIPQARVIENPRNLGFGAANNLGLREAETPYALLLNPDCEVSAAKVRDLLAVAHQYPDAALVAPQLLRESGAPEINYRWPSTHWRSRGPGADALCCVGFACGAALLLNMRVMREVGFFDEAFFLYYEDDDLCKRVFDARRAMLLVPAVTLVHASRGSVRGRQPWRAEYLRGYHHAQSKLLFTAKHESAESARAQRWRVLALALLTLPVRLLAPAPSQVARLVGRISGLWNARV